MSLDEYNAAVKGILAEQQAIARRRPNCARAEARM